MSFNFVAAVTILGGSKITADKVSVSPIICHEVMRPDAMILVF